MVKNLNTVERGEKVRIGKLQPHTQAENSVIVNASDTIVQAPHSGTFVSPIRYDTVATTNVLAYDTATNEIVTTQVVAVDKTLQYVTETGNTTTEVVQFTNGFVSPGPVGLAGNTEPAHSLDIGSNVYIDDTSSSGNVFFARGNVYIEGNLTTFGETTLIYSQNISVKDPIIELGQNNVNENLLYDLGVLMKRPGENVGVVYREAQDEVFVGYTPNTASERFITSSSNLVTMNVVGDVYANAYFGDGRTLTGMAFKAHLEDNVSRIEVLETDAYSNALRVSNLETQMSSNGIRVGNLESNLAANSVRISNLEFNLQNNSQRISTLTAYHTSNVLRIQDLEANVNTNIHTRLNNLESNLTDNSNRITTLSARLEDNSFRISVNTANIANLQVTSSNNFANIALLQTYALSNSIRVSTLETSLQSNALLLNDVVSNLAANSARITALEVLPAQLVDNSARISALEVDPEFEGIITGDGGNISNLTLQYISDIGNTTSNTLHLTGDVSLKTDGFVGINVEPQYELHVGGDIQVDGNLNSTYFTTNGTLNRIYGDTLVDGNTTIQGNLVVHGSTSYLYSENVFIRDPILGLGNNGLADTGIIIGVQSPANVVFGYDASETEFIVAHSTASVDGVSLTPDPTNPINFHVYGDVEANTITAQADVIVGGNLEVRGNTTFLQVDNLAVDDAIIKIAAGNELTTLDSGVVMERAEANVAMVYRGHEDELMFAYTTDDAAGVDITPDLSKHMNVHVYGSFFADKSINVNSNTFISETGEVTANIYFGDGGLLSNITQTLQGITDIGNTTTQTLLLTNTNEAINAVANIVSDGYYFGNGEFLTGISNAVTTNALLASNLETVRTYITSNVNILNDNIDSNLSTARTYISSNVNILNDNISSNLSTVRDYISSNVEILNDNIDSNLYTTRDYISSNVNILNENIISNLSTVRDYISSNVNILNENISTNLETTRDYISSNVEILNDNISSNLSTVRTYITSNVNILNDNISSNLSTARDYISSNVNILNDNIRSNVDVLNDNISSNLETTRTYISSNVNILNDNISSNLSTTRDYISSNVNILNDNISSNLGTTRTYITSNVNILNDNISSNLGTTRDYISSNVEILNDNISSNLSTTRTYITSNVDILNDNISSNLSTARDYISSNVNILNDNISSNLSTARDYISSNVSILNDNISTNLETTRTYITSNVSILNNNISTNLETVRTYMTDNVQILNDYIALKSNILDPTFTSNITVTSNVTTSELAVSTLTAGRVPYVGTDSFLVDHEHLTFTQGSPSVLSVGGDVNVSGNLKVQGSTTFLHTTNTIINDAIIELANNNTSDTIDMGFIMTRPSSNVGVGYRGDESEFMIGHTLSDPSGSDLAPDTANGIALHVYGSVDVDTTLAVDTDTLYVNATDDRVGVNTTTPGVSLDVRGDANVAALSAHSNVDIGTDDFFVDTNSGRVGIGTTLPIFELDVSGDANVATINVYTIQGLQTMAFNSDNTTTPPLQLTAGSLSDGIGAIRIDSVEPDIYLNDTNGGFATVTFANNDVQRAAFGRNSADDFYITVRDPAVDSGNWKDTTLVVDSSTGNITMAYKLGVNTTTFTGSNVLEIGGTANAAAYYGDGGLLSNIASTLDDVCLNGNTTTQVVSLLNTHTALTTDLTSNVQIKLDQLSNVVIGDDLTAEQRLIYDGANWVNDFNDNNFIRVINKTGADIAKGNTLYIVDSHNNNIANVALAKSDSSATMPCIGVASDLILNGTEGLAVTYGKVSGVNTVGFTQGQTLYVSNTAPGGIMASKPYDTVNDVDQIQNLGICIKENSENNGIIFVTGIGRSNDIPNANIVTQNSQLNYVYVNNVNNDMLKIDPTHLLTKLQTLQQVTDTGATTTDEVSFTNTDTWSIKASGNIYAESNITALEYYGDGTKLDGVALKTDLTDNAARVSVLEANVVDLWDNVYSNATILDGATTNISVLQSNVVDLWDNVYSNASTLATLKTDHEDNVLRIGVLEANVVDLWDNVYSNASTLATLKTDHEDNVLRIGVLEANVVDLWDNVYSNATILDGAASNISVLQSNVVDLWDNVYSNAARLDTAEDDISDLENTSATKLDPTFTSNITVNNVAYVNNGLVVNNTRFYAHSGSMTNPSDTIGLEFASNVFYARVMAQLVYDTEDVNTLVLELQGGKVTGAPTKNITVGTLNKFGDTTKPWSSTVTTTPTEVTIQPNDLNQDYDYEIMVEYTSAGTDSKLVAVKEGSTAVKNFAY